MPYRSVDYIIWLYLCLCLCLQCILYLELPDVLGGDEQADPDGDEEQADGEEGWQGRARGEDGLPGGQALLLEGSVVGSPGQYGAGARDSGPNPVLLRAVPGRHRSLA